MNEEQFIEALKEKGIILSNQQVQQFKTYYQELVTWNKKTNLTAITNKEDVYLKHFYDSISAAFDFPFNSQNIVDIGAGAGFPSIPLKIVFPNIKVTIVDSLTKRITFLNHLFTVLDVKDCKAFSARAEEYALQHRESYDVVMARAVARLPILNELCLPLVKVGGHFIALKGLKAKEEIEEARTGIKRLGGKIEKEISFTLTNEDTRTNIYIKKIKPTPKQYPRMYAKIKKQPL